MAETVDAWVALGANLGERRAALEAAFVALGRLPGTHLIRHSSLWASPPLDADGPDYLNAVALLRTSLDPFELLNALQSIELTQGRTRSYRNAPRTLDLDLLLHGRAVLDTPTLTLPHPRMATRAFVLRPLAELAPDLDIPGHGTVRQCLAHVAEQPCEAIPEIST
jgi:2-amino-4-hydroxy-6-hydroxymethyldihydropteridine diphosphokinase